MKDNFVCLRRTADVINKIEEYIKDAKGSVTYLACKHKSDYTIPPSNLEGCFCAFDRLYGVNSLPAIDFLRGCKESLNQEKALLLMSWYEHLVNIVLHGDQFRDAYQRTCFLVGKEA